MTRQVKHSTDGGRTWTVCAVVPGAVMARVGRTPRCDEVGNWYVSAELSDAAATLAVDRLVVSP